IAAELRLPADWKFGTALPVARTSGSDVQFRPVSMTTLVDSPVLAGRHFRRIELSPGSTPAHYLEIAADSDEALNVSPDLIEKYTRVGKGPPALSGGTPHRKSHFLPRLS